MQYKLTFSRVENLRLSLGWTWDQVAKALGVSKVMLHYVKTGKRNLSDKVIFRLEEAETMAGLRKPRPTAIHQEGEHDVVLAQFAKLKRRWFKHPSSRNEIQLALRVLFPDSSDEILKWLKQQ
jgi:transcriptional regulator with XRE-family HTH domain